MKIQVEKDEPNLYGLGVYFSNEEGYVKTLGLALLRWHIVLYFGKGDSYDYQW